MGARVIVLAFFLAATPEAAQPLWMTAAELAEAFPGLEVRGAYVTGREFAETYEPDGSIAYREAELADTGRWTIAGEDFCTFYRSLRGACFRIHRVGANCFQAYLTSDVAGITREEDLPRYLVAQFWRSVAPSTCPVIPTV